MRLAVDPRAAAEVEVLEVAEAEVEAVEIAAVDLEVAAGAAVADINFF
jgi:hypothetical protein